MSTIMMLFVALLFSKAANSQDLSDEKAFAVKALPFLEQSGFPWTQASAESWLGIIKEECGRRGMELALTLVDKSSNPDPAAVDFLCPELSLIDMSRANASDPFGMGMDIPMLEAVAKAENESSQPLSMVLVQADVLFQGVGGHVLRITWPAWRSMALWLAETSGEGVAVELVRYSVCANTGKWCDVIPTEKIDKKGYPIERVTLRVKVHGSGEIQITAPSWPTRGCRDSCTFKYPYGATIKIFVASRWSKFKRWGGVCSGVTALRCFVEMYGDHGVSATFEE